MIQFIANLLRRRRLRIVREERRRLQYERARAAWYQAYIECGDDYAKARRMAAVDLERSIERRMGW